MLLEEFKYYADIKAFRLRSRGIHLSIRGDTGLEQCDKGENEQ